MLARKALEPRFKQWNRRWGAPYGAPVSRPSGLGGWFWRPDEFDAKGMFGFQNNNDTRVFEYPWAFHFVEPAVGSRILEVGGGMSGFQFVLSRAGAKVVNVDPGMDDIGGRVHEDFFRRANRKYGTDVQLLERKIADVDLDLGVFDLIYSISVVEHIPPEELERSMERIGQLLRPGGRFIMTLDLFLDLAPFSRKGSNKFGTNVAVIDLLAASGLHLEFGVPEELYGFSQFDAIGVMELLPELFIGTRYPTLIQCVVMRQQEE
jgi:SAM-dependent methyltransferase